MLRWNENVEAGPGMERLIDRADSFICLNKFFYSSKEKQAAREIKNKTYLKLLLFLKQPLNFFSADNFLFSFSNHIFFPAEFLFRETASRAEKISG